MAELSLLAVAAVGVAVLFILGFHVSSAPLGAPGATTFGLTTSVNHLLATKDTGWERGCPCCGWTGHTFLKVGGREAVCPQCRAYERHRRACTMLGVGGLRRPLFEGRDSLFTRPPKREASGIPFRLVHFGPHRQMEKMLNVEATGIDQIGLDFLVEEYVKSGTYSENVFHADVAHTPLPSGFADRLIIMHVLEHVHNVRKGLLELKRVIRDDGWLLIEVPCRYGLGSHTDCTNATTKEERIKRCGQWDHVWKYDCDEWAQNLKMVGLSCYAIDKSHRATDFGRAAPIVDRFLIDNKGALLHVCRHQQ